MFFFITRTRPIFHTTHYINAYFYYYSDADRQFSINKPVEKKYVGDLWRDLDSARKIYNCSYYIPNHPKISDFFKAFNTLSYDEISQEEIIKELNSTPMFEIERLYRIVENKLKEFNSPKTEEELMNQFREISRIGLREGVYPSTLYAIYIINQSKRKN